MQHDFLRVCGRNMLGGAAPFVQGRDNQDRHWETKKIKKNMHAEKRRVKEAQTETKNKKTRTRDKKTYTV